MNWDALDRELDRWVERGRGATLWWRDDDATAVTPQLAPLLDLAARHAVPVALAVIPAAVEDSLPKALGCAPTCTVVQHGYAHASHARAGERSRELGGTRPLDDIASELRAGADRLRALFGERFLPIVVPPWNRIDDAVVRLLPGLGYAGVYFRRARRARARAGPRAGQRARGPHQLARPPLVRRGRGCDSIASLAQKNPRAVIPGG